MYRQLLLRSYLTWDFTDTSKHSCHIQNSDTKQWQSISFLVKPWRRKSSLCRMEGPEGMIVSELRELPWRFENQRSHDVQWNDRFNHSYMRGQDVHIVNTKMKYHSHPSLALSIRSRWTTRDGAEVFSQGWKFQFLKRETPHASQKCASSKVATLAKLSGVGLELARRDAKCRDPPLP